MLLKHSEVILNVFPNIEVFKEKCKGVKKWIDDTLGM
jgi:hypothetical protein